MRSRSNASASLSAPPTRVGGDLPLCLADPPRLAGPEADIWFRGASGLVSGRVHVLAYTFRWMDSRVEGELGGRGLKMILWPSGGSTLEVEGEGEWSRWMLSIAPRSHWRSLQIIFRLHKCVCCEGRQLMLRFVFLSGDYSYICLYVTVKCL